MRAIGQDGFGGPEVLKVVEVERPRPGPAEVLVRVHAAGVNPTDSWHRASGGLAGAVVRLGWDVSGVVEAVGPGVTTLAPGDEVFGLPRHPLPAGTYAEYVTSPARHLVRKPAGLTHVQAAALPLAGLTAWQALTDVADVRPGARVLVHAAAGGVGHLAVQIAKARGAHVIGTARAAKHDFLRGLGADELVDYTGTDFETAVAPVDVVLDTIGGAYGPRSLRTLRPGGTVVSLASPAEASLADQARPLGLNAAFMIVEADQGGMREIAALAAAGALVPTIDTVLPLEHAAKAHELADGRRTTGKIVLSVTD
ncbi:NADP-dependent oxidoreductase [Streptomyces sp. WAC05374]|uniref:NADP-dependent oxidoreductase n=1 Tax=Streptomyces sp. WAC05374 TaxID=2487420 RepID=UPI000F8621E0|nr:NADP-dependent oxidoreductase [Streptomyces sp. WAC05374]RST19080.1 NADP-dependent oxidoreductase [Streptomyces sp. WAC05374]TDF36952.1 NADP-dependent oxidoreductase [Streptomyces sp. WAC05374]TDF46447.1 NADP-dependent oxidoreductase [Streptomyces sp. WAC05374]TDF47548.1 NADP-dependent oxidoreductase [Streptomyces sp. WAC05374]